MNRLFMGWPHVVSMALSDHVIINKHHMWILLVTAWWKHFIWIPSQEKKKKKVFLEHESLVGFDIIYLNQSKAVGMKTLIQHKNNWEWKT